MGLFDWVKGLKPSPAISFAPKPLATPPPATAIPVPTATIPSPKAAPSESTVLRTSEIGISLIKEFESFKKDAYKDQAGIWTIGYGTIRVNGRPIVEGMQCTHDEALRWLHEEVEGFERAVNEVNRQAPANRRLSQQQFDACVCFAYNIGAGGFKNSTVTRKIKAGLANEVVEENFTAWNKVAVPNSNPRQLVPSAGLTRRRKSEFHLFRTGQVKTEFK